MTGILILNLFIASFAWTAFTTVSVNHFSFRYIYILALFSAFQVSVWLFGQFTGDYTLEPVRYLIFTLQEILMFAMLTRPFRNRKMELIIRTLFYFFLVMTSLYWHLWFDLAKIGLLISLAATHPKAAFRKYMTAVMGVFAVSYVMFYVFGIDSFGFVSAGLLYAVMFLIATLKLYKIDNVETKLIEQVGNEMLGNKKSRG